MNTELKNLYENLIQDMIMEGITGMTPEIKELIHNAPVEKRRSMILTILEENNVEHRLLSNKIQNTLNVDNYSEMNHIKDVVGMLREYVKVSKTEVKTMGEVMTPITLVEEMLDTLPYEVWSNPNLKWLDPCNGVGTFFSVVIERLMKGLESFEPNEKLRYKHIVENMIYACELQPKNLFLYLYAFDPKDEYAMNVYCGSYLDEGFDKHMEIWNFLGVDKFDVIVMNPPYNTYPINGKTHPLWDKFVVKTINQLIDGGYLVAVHPSGWRNVEGKFKNIQTLLKSKQLIYLEFNSTNDGVKTFGVQTAYDFYCLHNKPNTIFTKIKCVDGLIERIDLSKMEFIPSGMFKEIQNLIAKQNESIVELISDCNYHTQKNELMSKEYDNNFKYPCIDNIGIKNNITCIWYSNNNNKGHFGKSKIIFGQRHSGVVVDENGIYGLTQHGYAIVDESKNLPFIEKAMLNNDFINMLKYCDFGGARDRYNRKVIATFRKDFWKEFLK